MTQKIQHKGFVSGWCSREACAASPRDNGVTESVSIQNPALGTTWMTKRASNFWMCSHLLFSCMQPSFVWTVRVLFGLVFARPRCGSFVHSVRSLARYIHFFSYKKKVFWHASNDGPREQEEEEIERPWWWHNVCDSIKQRHSNDAVCTKFLVPGRKDWLFEEDSMQTILRLKFPSFTESEPLR